MDAPAKRRVATEAELRAWVRLNVRSWGLMRVGVTSEGHSRYLPL